MLVLLSSDSPFAGLVMLLGWLDSERLRLLDKPRPLPAGPAINEAARKSSGIRKADKSLLTVLGTL
jgi:hypothetical protein